MSVFLPTKEVLQRIPSTSIRKKCSQKKKSDNGGEVKYVIRIGTEATRKNNGCKCDKYIQLVQYVAGAWQKQLEET